MVKVNTQSVKNSESKRFNDNASRIVIGWGEDAIIGLFGHLGYECQVTGKGTYRIPCPVCKTSNALIGVDGRIFPLWWKCHSKECPSAEGKQFKNLLGLARACVGGNLGEAYKAIAAYMGASCPFHITNLSDADVEAAIKAGRGEAESEPVTTVQTPKVAYVFVVPDATLKTSFDKAGINAVMEGQPTPKDCFVYPITDPFGWEYLSPDVVRTEAEAVLREAGVTP